MVKCGSDLKSMKMISLGQPSKEHPKHNTYSFMK